jgi:imidazolonepropionase-like amidohydrolase
LTPDRATTPQEKDWLERRNLPLETIERANDAAKEHGHWFSRALNAGVKMALGSDRQPLHQTTFLEMGMWIKAGATPENTILAATRNAAELCGFGDKLGTVEPGKLADLIVVRNNPLEQIESFRDLSLVLKNGVVITDNL